MKRKHTQGKARDRRVVLLADLAPRKDVKGGAGKLLFGEHPEPPIVEESDPERDRPARRGSSRQ